MLLAASLDIYCGKGERAAANLTRLLIAFITIFEEHCSEFANISPSQKTRGRYRSGSSKDEEEIGKKGERVKRRETDINGRDSVCLRERGKGKQKCRK